MRDTNIFVNLLFYFTKTNVIIREGNRLCMNIIYVFFKITLLRANKIIVNSRDIKQV